MDDVKKVNLFPTIAGNYDKHYKLVEQCFDYIDRMNTQIQRIQADDNISIIEKQRKITRCQDNINGYKNEIEETKRFLETCNAWTHAMQARFDKVK
ncbi:MAG: hypothetical protein IKP05_03380 [Alphaproteobacteria bacterium]|nr:hypothetical protein [Alphaproteobacteria bacterium]